MKKLIFIILAFVSLTTSAQYTIQRPIPGRVVYGGAPVFVQSAKVMFVADGASRTDVNWNTFAQNVSNGSLINNSGISIGWKITIPDSPDWDIDAPVSISAIGDWTSVALSRAVYTYMPGDIKTITFSSLNTVKQYKIRIASLQGYDDPVGDNKTNVTVNGVTKQLLNAVQNTLYEQNFIVTSPVSGNIDISITPASGGTYGLFCAIILEEYTP